MHRGKSGALPCSCTLQIGFCLFMHLPISETFNELSEEWAPPAFPVRMRFATSWIQRALGCDRPGQTAERWYEGAHPEFAGAAAKDNRAACGGARTFATGDPYARQRYGDERTVARSDGMGEEAPGRKLLRAEFPGD